MRARLGCLQILNKGERDCQWQTLSYHSMKLIMAVKRLIYTVQGEQQKDKQATGRQNMNSKCVWGRTLMSN